MIALIAGPGPVARALTWATMSTALSKGMFFSVSVLFFTRVAGLSPATIACGLYATAASRTVMVAVVVLTLATVAHTLAEVLSEAGSWTLAFELADPANAGAYQGVSQTGAALGSMLAPALVTATAIEHGFAGWAVLAALFLAAGLCTAWLVGRAPRSRPGL
jgi:hypothetical protein